MVEDEDKTIDSEEDPESDEGLKNVYSKGLAISESEDFRWYVTHVLTGHENKICKALRERIFNQKLENLFSDIVIPEETVVSNVSGKKRTIKRKFFPGYVLIRMIMNDKTWHLVKDTDKVTGFVGGTKQKPTPLSESEANEMLHQAQEGTKKVKTSVSFVEGDMVKVTEGPFSSFVGTVETVGDKGKIRVQVSIFGRLTPVELDFTQVEKVTR